MTSAIAIINWNSGNRLRRSVESVLATSDASEIVVVDNASADGSIEGASIFGNRVLVIRNAVNRGFAGGMNQAFDATRAETVLALNPDAQATPGAIAELERLIGERPRAGAIGGDVNERYAPRELPTWLSLAAQNLGLGRQPRQQPPPSQTEAWLVGQPAAAAMLIRRAAFEAVGGFDEAFFPAWYEDVDFCRRLQASGWEMYFAPHAKFVHDGGYSAEVLGPKAFAAVYYRNQLRYAKKHLSRSRASAVRASIVVGMAARILVQPRQAAASWNVLCGALGGW